MHRFSITKVIEFSYGHRIPGHQGKCRHLHGHNGMLEVDVAADALDDLGMVIDFSRISATVKAWVDETIDHRMLLWREDPLVAVLAGAGEILHVVDDIPTAENIARLIWEAARDRGLPVSEVRLWETSTSRASYRGEGWSA
jgi:6-pyruvoyltetrahydropterin/6-carboxytetrahydropterin synthase